MYITKTKIQQIAAGVGGGGPCDAPAGDELWAYEGGDSHASLSKYSGIDNSSSPSIDSTVSLLRTKAANPVIDITTDSNATLIMPSHTADIGLSLAIDLDNEGLDFDADWTIEAKISVPLSYHMADNGVHACLGASLPEVGGANELNRNAAQLFAVEVDTTEVDRQWGREDDSAPTFTEWLLEREDLSTTFILKLVHDISVVEEVIPWISTDNGNGWTELSSTGKDPAAFTHSYIWTGWTKHASGYGEGIFRLHYWRAYQSVKFR